MSEHLPAQLLFTFSVLFVLLYVFKLRTLLIDRLLYSSIALAGIAVVAKPDLATMAANAIGIGRGADLLLYMFVLFTLILHTSLTADRRKFERQLTMVVRNMAVVTARPAGEVERGARARDEGATARRQDA